MKEIWKHIEGYNGLYEVSNLGRIKSLERYAKRKRVNGYFDFMHIPNKIRKQHISKLYYAVTLDKKVDGEVSQKTRKTFHVHRLVAKAFIQNPEKKKEVNHIDADKLNNNAYNLEWCTRQENIAHAERNNLVPRMKGSKNGKTYLNEQQVIEIFNSKGKLRIIAKKFNTTKSTVWNIRNRVTWWTITNKI